MSKQSEICFAIPGKTIIDLVNPETMRTQIYGKTLDDVKREKGYIDAVLMTIDEYMESKANAQNTPIEWIECERSEYTEMLNCLPPVCWSDAGFMVGEPYDHCTKTGRPRFQAYRKNGTHTKRASRPMTVPEFKDELKRPF